MSELVLGIVGRPSAGKDEAANFFIHKGFHNYSTADVIRKLLNEAHPELEETRKNMQIFITDLRKEKGSDIVIQIIKKDLQKPAVITGFRNPDEVRVMKNEKNFYLLGINASKEVRYQRSVERKRANEGRQTFDEFVKIDDEEWFGTNITQKTKEVFEMADTVIDNDQTLEEFHKKLENVYNNLVTVKP